RHRRRLVRRPTLPTFETWPTPPQSVVLFLTDFAKPLFTTPRREMTARPHRNKLVGFTGWRHPSVAFAPVWANTTEEHKTTPILGDRSMRLQFPYLRIISSVVGAAFCVMALTATASAQNTSSADRQAFSKETLSRAAKAAELRVKHVDV